MFFFSIKLVFSAKCSSQKAFAFMLIVITDTMFYTKILLGASMNFNRRFYRDHYIFLECHKLEISPGNLKHEILIIAAS